MILATTLTFFGELFLLLFFGVWLFPGGNIHAKVAWTIGFCGIGMGVVVGTLSFWLVDGRIGGIKAVLTTGGLSFLVIGVGCNAICFMIDRKFNYFGAVDQPLVWIGSGVVMSLLGGIVLGSMMFLKPVNRESQF